MRGCPEFIFSSSNMSLIMAEKGPFMREALRMNVNIFLLNYFAFAGIKVLKYSYCTERGKN
jgi:hypothetical protein